MTVNVRNPLSSLKSRLGAACAAVALLATSGAQAADLNALIWCDHSDPALLQPFEEAN
ncbi:MAG: spermidine/putrescine ABC transporter substrate-binding protein, partial [Mesorhizobium sp.]